MFSLLNKDDSKLMKNSTFVKNAVLYKDIFAFSEAYQKIMAEDKANLPNFCFLVDGQYCLEGICLIIKLYATEFGFETLRLTLDYLKVIYFTIASYSKDGLNVDVSLIKNEFEEYKTASVEIVSKVKKDIDKSKSDYDKLNRKYDKLKSKYANNLVVSKFYRVFKIVTFILAFFGAMFPFTLYYLEKISLTTTIISSLIILATGLLIYALFKILTRKTETLSKESAYILQTIKKEKDDAYKLYNEILTKNNRIISEKYEFIHSLKDIVDLYPKKLTFSEIIKKASEYKLISYNIVHDVKKLFETQQKDVNDFCQEIMGLSFSENSNKELINIYERIKNCDWLYYNNEVRFSFINKHVELAQKNHQWFMDINSEKVLPFDVDIRAIAKEEVAYLNSKDDLFVASSIDKFLNTKYAKQLKTFELKANTNPDELKTIKVEYINHFFEYNKVKQFDNLFYDRKILEGVKVTDDVINENEKIPTYAYLKIKLLENSIGLGNNSFSVIKQIASEIENTRQTKLTIPIKEKQYVFSEKNINYPDYECEQIEQIEENLIKYVIGENKVVGFKLANI